VHSADQIAEWKSMKAELERQLAAFDPPMRLRTFTTQRETTQESKAHIRRCIVRLDELLNQYVQGCG
jgi:hypothetical protein